MYMYIHMQSPVCAQSEANGMRIKKE